MAARDLTANHVTAMKSNFVTIVSERQSATLLQEIARVIVIIVNLFAYSLAYRPKSTRLKT